MATSSPAFVLRRCSNTGVVPSKPLVFEVPELENEEGQDASPAINRKDKGRIMTGVEVSGSTVTIKGAPLSKRKKAKKTNVGPWDASSSSSCTSSEAPSSSSVPKQHRGVHLRSRRPRQIARCRSCGRVDGDLEELALPLGMSFAAVIARVLEKNALGERVAAEHLAKVSIMQICTSAVNEAVENVFGRKFESFLRSFSKSFGSTLNTLWLINERKFWGPEGISCASSVLSEPDEAQRIPVPDLLGCTEELEVCQPLNPQGNQLLVGQQLDPQGNGLLELNGHLNQRIVQLPQHRDVSGFSDKILSTFEKSVVEQIRSNDLKAVEIGLTLKRLQLKKSQLDLSFCSNLLEKVKINMGFQKAHFKEEKFKLQREDTKHAELRKVCIDFLIAGLVIMSAFLSYGAWIYSYKRIAEATASCTPSLQEPKPWWFPKQVASFNSGWQMLRCQAVVFSRMTFGMLLILVIAYSLFQRSASSGPMMPVSFILLILGAICGFAGKICVDSLGGSGFCWLLHWEILCMLHFLANFFPSTTYLCLYGPLTVSQERKTVLAPYWLRRCAFYGTILLVLPLICGLMPFASVGEWTRHFTALVQQPAEEV